VDANIIFSALIRDDSTTGKMIFSDKFKLFFPEDGLLELDKYEEYIINKRNKNRKRILSYEYLLNSLFDHIEIVPSKHYCDKIVEAYDIMKDIDEKDTIYVALALKLNSDIWSNDKHLKMQNRVKTYNTADLLKIY
jgi:predicted nucleic acid-binding protein